jgi:hypothetical protein
MGETKIDTRLNKSRGQQMEIPCTNCASRTSHIVLQSVDVTGHEDLDSGERFFWDNAYQIIQCMGCNTVSFRHTHTNSEDGQQTGPDYWEYGIIENLYPSRVEGRKQLQDRRFLPPKVRLIYEETHKALCDGLRVLTGVGLRAIIETVCKDKAADGKNLNEKIDDLVKKGMLTQDGAGILHQLRTLGNRAAHEVQPHEQDQLLLAMDVAEHLLEGAYIFPEKARRTFK